MNDVKLTGAPTISSYIETRVDYSVVSEIPDGEGSTNAYIAAYIQMDDTLKTTTRQVSTFSMAIAQTGGFMTVIFLITVVIVQRLQKTIYFTSLI